MLARAFLWIGATDLIVKHLLVKGGPVSLPVGVPSVVEEVMKQVGLDLRV